MDKQTNLFGTVQSPPVLNKKEVIEPPTIFCSHCPQCCTKLELRKEGGFFYFECCNRVWDASPRICPDCENNDGTHDIFCKFKIWS